MACHEHCVDVDLLFSPLAVSLSMGLSSFGLSLYMYILHVYTCCIYRRQFSCHYTRLSVLGRASLGILFLAPFMWRPPQGRRDVSYLRFILYHFFLSQPSLFLLLLLMLNYKHSSSRSWTIPALLQKTWLHLMTFFRKYFHFNAKNKLWWPFFCHRPYFVCLLPVSTVLRPMYNICDTFLDEKPLFSKQNIKKNPQLNLFFIRMHTDFKWRTHFNF